MISQALALHSNGKVQPDNRYEPVATSVRTPEQIPPMKSMLAPRKESCIHCHDVKVAELRHAGDLRTLRKDMVFTYSSPSNLGIDVDPFVQFRVRKVEANAPAATAGVRVCDLNRTMDEQRILTLADMSRMLELTPTSGKLRNGLERSNSDQFVVLGQPLATAVAAARLHTEGTASLSFEKSWPVSEMDELRQLGYSVTIGSTASTSSVARQNGLLQKAQRKASYRHGFCRAM